MSFLQSGAIRLACAALLVLPLAATAASAAAAAPPALKRVALPKPAPLGDPLPLMVSPGAPVPIRLERVKLDGTLHGSVIETTLELSFVNPNPRVLEGELQFPLQDGQTITGFALEMADGTFMPAVPVPRARGRQAFEDTIRVRVDPAVLEHTEGNRFRLRIYPLNPNQPRHVRLQFSEALPGDGRLGRSLRLPLDFGSSRAEHLELHLQLPAVDPRDLTLGGILEGAAVRGGDGETLVDLVRENFQAPTAGSDRATLRWRGAAGDSVASDRSEGQAWFHAELAVPDGQRPRPRPQQLVLVWDASGSGALRDHAAELQLLDRLFRWQPALHVVLRVVRDAAEPARSFEVRNGDWHLLRSTLEGIAYDGASNAGLWRIGEQAADAHTLALLFSDGLGNWGSAAADEPGSATAFAVASGAGANAGWLRRWAEARHGQLLDLSRLDGEALGQALTTQGAELLRVDGSGFDQLALESRFPSAGHVRLAARFAGSRAQLDLVWGLPGGGERHQALSLAAPALTAEREPGFAARRWAGLRITELSAEPALHRAEIASLGERFGVVTAETSLIVLENLADYQRFGVLPPNGPLRTRYLTWKHDSEADETRQRNRHLDELRQRYRDYLAWWQRDFPKDTPLPPDEKPVELGERRLRQEMLRDAPPPMAPIPGRAEGAGAASMASPAVAAAKAATLAQPGLMQQQDGAASPIPAGESAARIAVNLAPWTPDTASQRRLRDAAPAQRYAVYLDERGPAARSPAFYLDAAEVFAQRGEPALALRILSNLAELDAGNRDLLRVLAYRLQQEGQGEEAVRQLRRVAELAPDEPQSWRDLGLALAAAGHHQEAVDALWRVASGLWSPRFADIDLIALTELDALAALHEGLDLAAVPAELRRNLPLDLRVALSWDADNTDVDLWVLDPNGQWTSYQQPQSYQGGHVSRDCTQGYGPEVFSLRSAKPGHYEVRARYYGSRRQTVGGYPTLMMHLARGFGTSQEAGRDIVVRLEQVKDDVLVGSFDVGSAAAGGSH